MKSTISKVIDTKLTRESTYPLLGIVLRTGCIVLLTSFGCGAVLHPGSASTHMGYESSSWMMDEFKLYLGEITLSNN